MKSIHTTMVSACACFLGTSIASAGELTIATVSNGSIIEMQMLAPTFLAENPDITINWVTLDEGTLRDRVTDDITTGRGQFDIMTIGTYETPIWGERGWLAPLSVSDSYDVEDLLPAMRNGLSHDGTLYAAPFYGESSMIIYRRDLLRAAGLTMQDNPSWEKVAEAAAAMTDRDAGQYGLCLRGKAGWGENMAFVSTMANSFGGQWFNEDWTPAIDTPEWKAAVTLYVDLLTKYGPPSAADLTWGDNLVLMQEGKCGLWIDATSLAAAASDPDRSDYADRVEFAQAPQQVTTKGANWLWSWALAVPAGSAQTEDAMKFIEWATSKEYIELVAEREGWGGVPTGTRESTYLNPDFQAEARFADAELQAILTANPNDSTLNPSPYVGVQFASIPEFAEIGNYTGQQISSALAGEITVAEALKASQELADQVMKEAGYY